MVTISSIFYGSTFSEFLRIARCSLLVEDFVSRASTLFKRMVTQGGNPKLLKKQIVKAFERYPQSFVAYKIDGIELAKRVENQSQVNRFRVHDY